MKRGAVNSLKGALITLTSVGKGHLAFKASRELGYFGWFWFEYGDFCGKKEFLNMPRHVFFPEDLGECTGFGYLVKPGVTGTALPYWSQGVHADAVTVAQGVIDLTLGKVGGLSIPGSGSAARVLKRAGSQRLRLNLNLGG